RFGMYRRIEAVLDRNPRRSKAVVDQRVDEVSGLNIEQPSALERLLYQRSLFGRTRRAIIRRGLEEPHVGTRHRNRQDLLDHLIAIPYREQELDAATIRTACRHVQAAVGSNAPQLVADAALKPIDVGRSHAAR